MRRRRRVVGTLLAADDELAAGKPYAERLEPSPGALDRIAELLAAATIRPVFRLVRNPSAALRIVVREAARHEAALRAATDAELAARAAGMRARLRYSGFTPAVVGECFALISEAASRTLRMRHFDVQMMAGWGLLQGKLVEMATGEGKTLAAALPAATVALAGYPVHVITVNDYLAARDAAELEPLYRYLGLTVGTVVAAMERPDRAAAYGRSIVYTTIRTWRSTTCGTVWLWPDGRTRCALRLSGCGGDGPTSRIWCCTGCILASSMKPTACSSTKRERR